MENKFKKCSGAETHQLHIAVENIGSATKNQFKVLAIKLAKTSL